MGSFKTQISPKNTKIQVSGGETPPRKRLGKGALNTCAKFQGLTLKNGVDIGI